MTAVSTVKPLLIRTIAGVNAAEAVPDKATFKAYVGSQSLNAAQTQRHSGVLYHGKARVLFSKPTISGVTAAKIQILGRAPAQNPVVLATSTLDVANLEFPKVELGYQDFMKYWAIVSSIAGGTLTTVDVLIQFYNEQND